MQEEHLLEFMDLKDICDCLKKFPRTALNFVSEIPLLTSGDDKVQEGVKRFNLKGQPIIRGHEKRVPQGFWRKELQNKDSDGNLVLSQEGNPVTAKHHPLRGAASADSDFLRCVVR